MKKIIIDFDLKYNIIKNLKQLLKKFLIKKMNFFNNIEWSENNQEIMYIIKKRVPRKIVIINSIIRGV